MAMLFEAGMDRIATHSLFYETRSRGFGNPEKAIDHWP